MIRNKNDLKAYLEEDRKALGISWKHPRVLRDDIWRFEILLRKTEYSVNCKNGPFGKIQSNIYKMLLHRASIRLGYSIPLNAFGKGLSLAHYGSVVVNHTASIGDYCRIQENTTIGATGGESSSPTIGDYVFIGSGARIIGNIRIADGVVVGAGSVVVKDVLENNVTVAGVPAKIISNSGSEKFMQMKG